METKQLKTRFSWNTRVWLNHAGLWGNLEQLRLLWKGLQGKPHEEDFQFFSRFEGKPGLFVDIGANIGQSAISFRIYNKSMNILSFEPNPMLASRLGKLSPLLGARFQWRAQGLGAVAGRSTIYFPIVQGVPLYQEGTTSVETLRADEHVLRRVRETTGRENFEIGQAEIERLRFDDLGLGPFAVKIDVQGDELAVLQGMEATLARAAPILMIEGGAATEKIAAFLNPRGYRGPYSYELAGQRLVPSLHRSMNSFYVPESAESERFMESLALPMSDGRR